MLAGPQVGERRLYMQTQDKLSVPIYGHLTDNVIPYEPPKCIGMLCNESVKTSAFLALPDTLKSF